MMHPEISRELSRAQQQETLRRVATPAARVVRETADDGAPHKDRRHGPFSALRLVARLQPRD